MKKALVLGLAAAVIIAGCGHGRNAEKTAETVDSFPLDSLEIKYNPVIEKGIPAPAFELPDTLGKVFSLNDFKGDYLILYFWASWCGDCRREIPEVKALFEEWKDRKIDGKAVRFLSVSFDHDAESWKNMLRAEAFEWPQVSNLVKYRGHPLAAAYGIHWIPSIVIVDPDGNIAGAAITARRVDFMLKQLNAHNHNSHNI